VDFDGDGRLDILSGSFPGELYFFRRGSNGRFLAGEKIKGVNGNELNPGNAATVFAVDFNNDGKLDLVCGNIDGEVLLYLNEGTTRPSFSAARKLEAGGRVIRVRGGDSHPVVADWDSDGKPDLIVGTGGGEVMFYRNTGTGLAPRFATGQPLIVASEPDGKEVEGPKSKRIGRRLKVCVCDFNGDGRLDLLVGDFHMNMNDTAKRKDANLPKTDAHLKAEKKVVEILAKHKAVFAELRQVTKVPAKETLQAKVVREKKLKEVQARVQKVFEEARPYQEIIALSQTGVEYHGFVWLLPRKRHSAR
jgi:hypothetical protein